MSTRDQRTQLRDNERLVTARNSQPVSNPPLIRFDLKDVGRYSPEAMPTVQARQRRNESRYCLVIHLVGERHNIGLALTVHSLLVTNLHQNHPRKKGSPRQ